MYCTRHSADQESLEKGIQMPRRPGGRPQGLTRFPVNRNVRYILGDIRPWVGDPLTSCLVLLLPVSANQP